MKCGLFLLSLVTIIVFAGCDKSDFDFYSKKDKAVSEETDQAQPSQAKEDPTAKMPDFNTVNAATVAIYSGDKVNNVTAEVVKTDEERAKGLSNRASLPKGFGMWFVFTEEVREKFWMKDTLIPLDIIYVDPDMTVVDTIQHAVPQSTDLLEAKAPFQYVLEVNAGFIEQNGIKEGDRVEYRIGPK